ncbi:MAG: type III-A CRISPR-associated RAMP protein Csm3 [Flavobacteriaceae bacterium]|nr:type III-A CRISPR-associated RAMP protein Csm3 [Flavobacteriaceae bacterium]
MKLIKKHVFRGEIELKSGLHIGGNKSSLDIGGLDSPVIKTVNGVPYIPGSSLKGKMRSLLAMKEGADEISKESKKLKQMFGSSEQGMEEKTRLMFRDAQLNIEKFKESFAQSILLVTEYTEEKWENKIDRKSGKAEGGLRQTERVPAGSVFSFEIVLDEYEGDETSKYIETLKQGFELLENDYIGGSGSRGYGHIKINDLKQSEVKTFN